MSTNCRIPDLDMCADDCCCGGYGEVGMMGFAGRVGSCRKRLCQIVLPQASQ